MMVVKRGQSAIEFVIIFGFLLVFFSLFFAIIQSEISNKNKERERIILQNVALDVQEEINLAAGSSEGYRREFSVPPNILGRSYVLNVTQGRVFASIEGFSISYKVAEVEGQVQSGTNVIIKENGTAKINS